MDHRSKTEFSIGVPVRGIRADLVKLAIRNAEEAAQERRKGNESVEAVLEANDLAEGLSMSQSAVSHQLSDMRELHLVQARRAGRHVYYRLDDEHVRDLFLRGLEHVKHG